MNKLINRKNNNQSGFSIIEVLIVIFIITLIIIVITNFQINIFALNKTSSADLVAQEDARRILKNASAEIRSMSPSNMGAYPIAEAGTSTLIFYDDLDGDTLKEKIRYFLDGATLKKGVLKPTGVPLTYSGTETIKELVHNVSNAATTSIFSYYDTNYDGTSAPLNQPINIPDIRLIKVYIIIDQDPLRPPGPFSMTTQASVRNLKDNQ